VTILSASPVQTLVHCVVKHSRPPDLKSSSNVSLPFAWITCPRKQTQLIWYYNFWNNQDSNLFSILKWLSEPQFCEVFMCVQMDFTQTFEANTKCNNINHVWSHFYKILVVLKYRRRPWANIFDTDICRSINIPKNAKYIHHFNVGIYASRNVCVKDINSRVSMVLQNYQTWFRLLHLALASNVRVKSIWTHSLLISENNSTLPLFVM
jgi:hypothetical protein